MSKSDERPATPASDYTAHDLAFKLEVMATNIEILLPMGELERKFLRSAAAHLRLSAQSESAAIPAGWKLVPVELTEPMRIAGYLYKPKLEARCLYRALLDAAPQVPGSSASTGADGGGEAPRMMGEPLSPTSPIAEPATAARDYSDKAWPFPTGRT